MRLQSRSPSARARALAALFAATALAGLGSPAAAQEAASPAELKAQVEALQAQLRLLQGQIDQLQAQIGGQQAAAAAAPTAPAASPGPIQLSAAPSPAPSAPPAATIEWKGAPEFSTPSGFRFKVRGRLQYDGGVVENPQDRLPGDTYGFNSRVRRLRLGVEGWFPGDIQYKAEADFANSAVGYGDVILYWQPKGKIYSLGVGNYDTFQNLEQPTSSRYISFLERAQMVEAFDQTRHLGVWGGLADPKHDAWRINLGLFNDRIRADNTAGRPEGSYGNDDWLLAARGVYSPRIAGGRLHLGVNYQRRRFQTNDLAQTYAARPFSQTIDQRFVSTGAIAARGDQIMGLEAGAVFGPLHVVGEAQRVKVDAIRPGEALTGRQATAGARYNGDPSFTGWYAEVGYFLTGESRGYAKGLWDRTRVKRPVSQGGPGAVQLNLRYDRLNLSDRVAGTGFAAPDYVNGGRQSGLLTSAIWQPIDYVRFTLQYTRVWVKGGPLATAADPGATATAGKFSTNVYLARAQFDF